MENILIIGNGFDLYHHFPTRYTDFLFFVNHWDLFMGEHSNATVDNNPDEYLDISLSKNGELIDQSIIDFAKYKNTFDDSCIKLFDQNVKNHWIKYFSVIPTLKRGNEISYFVPSSTLKFIKEFNEDESDDLVLPIGVVVWNATSYDFSEWKKEYIKHILDSLNSLMKCLCAYISTFVCRIKCNYYSKQINDLLAVSNIRLLNFNYTDTFNSVYRDDKLIADHAVHGNALKRNIVLGIPDDSFRGTEYVYFQKFFQRIQKNTGSFYKDWIRLVQEQYYLRDLSAKEDSQVFVFGHSLAETDKGVLKDFFLNDFFKRITVFYHSQKSYEEMVINLVEMFGKDFVIENTGSNRVSFVKLEDAINSEIT